MKTIKIISIIASIAVLSTPNYALMALNDIVEGFGNGDGKNQAIEEYVVAGAKNFIESNKNALALINEFEINPSQAADISAALTCTENALRQLPESRSHYAKAKELGEQAGYNMTIIPNFKAFDYDEYIDKYGLNKEIAEIAKFYFKKGDLLGIYQKNIDNLDATIITLTRIRDTLKTGESPPIRILWDCIQQYANAALFGNYTTRISVKIIHNAE